MASESHLSPNAQTYVYLSVKHLKKGDSKSGEFYTRVQLYEQCKQW